MRRILVTIPFCLCALAVWAEPGPRASQGDPQQILRDQRRSELRDVLRPPRPSDFGPVSTSVRVEPPAPPSRHLTPQERAELREQLRREQNESRRNRQ